MSAAPETLSGCPADEQLKAYVDGELGLVETTAVRAHVHACARCGEEIRIMRAIGEQVRSLEGAVEPPAGLRQRVFSRIEFRPEGARRINRFNLVEWATAGVIAAVIAAVLFPMFSQARQKARLSSSLQSEGAPSAAMARAREVPSRPNPFQPNRDLVNPPNRVVIEEPGVEEERSGLAGQANLRQYAQRSRDYDEVYRSAQPAGGMTSDDVRKYSQGIDGRDFKRKVVQTATLGVRVNRGLEELQDLIAAKVGGWGGYVENSDLSSPGNGDRVSSMVLRVPVDRFDAAMTYLSGLGEVTAKNVQGEDVTGTWIDQRSEVREMRSQEAQLLREYEKAKSNQARWNARWQLLQLRQQMKAAEERFALTTKLAALSTFNLTLTEQPQARIRGNLLNDLENVARGAVAAFFVAVRVPAAIVIWMVVFAPLWIPLALILRWASRNARLHRDPPV